MKDITSSFAIEIYSGATSTWTDYTLYALAGSLNIDHELNTRSVCTFTLYDSDNQMVMPSVGQKVRITDGSDAYFGGQIEDIEYRAMRPGGTPQFYVQIKCTDYSALLDRYYVTATYEGMYSGAIVKDLINYMGTADQLDTTNVANGPVVAKMVVPTITIQEALDELARETGYKYKVGYDGSLYWFDRTSDTASWDLTDATAATRTVGIPVVKRERSQYRNVQEVRGGSKADDADNYYPPVSEDGMLTYYTGDKIYSSTLIADDLNDPIWDLGRPIDSISRVYVSTTAAVGSDLGSIYLVGAKGGDAPFYFSPGSRYLYMNYSWTSGGTTYYWWELFPVNQYRYVRVYGKFRSEASAVAMKTNAWCAAQGVLPVDTIEQMAAIEGGSGIYKRIEVNERLLTVEECQAKADGLLKQYGVIPTIVDYQSDNWGDLAVGQWQNVSIYGLNKDCVVKSIKISDIQGEWLRAQVQLVGSEKQGFAQFWRQVMGGQTARMQTTYAVRSSEVATEYTFPDDNVVWFDDSDLTYTEVTAFSTWGSGAIGEGAEWA